LVVGSEMKVLVTGGAGRGWPAGIGLTVNAKRETEKTPRENDQFLSNT